MPLTSSRSYALCSAASNFQQRAQSDAALLSSRSPSHEKLISNTSFCIPEESFLQEFGRQEDVAVAKQHIKLNVDNISSLKDAHLFIQRQEGYLLGCLVSEIAKNEAQQTLEAGREVFECCSRAFCASEVEGQKVYQLKHCDTSLSVLMPDYVKMLAGQASAKTIKRTQMLELANKAKLPEFCLHVRELSAPTGSPYADESLMNLLELKRFDLTQLPTCHLVLELKDGYLYGSVHSSKPKPSYVAQTQQLGKTWFECFSAKASSTLSKEATRLVDLLPGIFDNMEVTEL